MSNKPRRDVLVTGPVANFVLGACNPSLETSYVLVRVDGVYYFDDYNEVPPQNIVVLQSSTFPGGPITPDNTKVWFQILSDGSTTDVFLNWSISDNLLKFSAISNLYEVYPPPMIDLYSTGMPTDGKALYAWVDMLFDMNSDRQVNIKGVNETGYQLIPLALSWTASDGNIIESSSIIDPIRYQYSWRNAVFRGDRNTQKDLEFFRGVTTFSCNSGVKDPYYTTTSCGEAWSTVYSNSIGQQIMLGDGDGFAIPDNVNMVCSDRSLQRFTEITNFDLKKLLVWDYMTDNEYIVKDFIQNRATIRGWILDNIFTLYPGICSYITSGNRCKSEVCGKCKDSYCTDSFNGYCNDKVQWWVIVMMCIMGVLLLILVVIAVWAFISRNKALNNTAAKRRSTLGET